MWRACALPVSANRRCSCTGSGITRCAIHQLRPKPLQGGGVGVASVAKVCAPQDLPDHTRQNAFCPLSRWGAHHAQIAARGLAKMCSSAIPLLCFQGIYDSLPPHSTSSALRRRNARWFTHSESRSRSLGLSTYPPSHLCHHPARTAAPIKAEQAWSRQHATPQRCTWLPPVPR